MTRTRRAWSKSIGEPGCRVRLYEARPGGPIMRSSWVSGKEDRKSLGHRDRELATRQAYDLLRGLLANEQAIREESLTLGLLARMYLESPQHQAKGERAQREDRRKVDRVVAFLGADRNLLSLSESDVRRYTMARREGDSRLQGVRPKKPVRDRAIEADLLALHRALNWAVRERRSSGQRLMRENPLQGIKLPRERNPRRSVMHHDVYLKLLEIAEAVHPVLKLALVVAEGTGRRISGWRNLRKGYPVKDVAAAGGWRDERTILTSYRQVDAAMVKQVVLHPTQWLMSG